MQGVLVEAVNLIQSHEFAGSKGYAEAIQPRIRAIQRDIDKGNYLNLRQFVADIRLVFLNTITLNLRSSKTTSGVSILLDYFNQQLPKIVVAAINSHLQQSKNTLHNNNDSTSTALGNKGNESESEREVIDLEEDDSDEDFELYSRRGNVRITEKETSERGKRGSRNKRATFRYTVPAPTPRKRIKTRKEDEVKNAEDLEDQGDEGDSSKEEDGEIEKNEGDKEGVKVFEEKEVKKTKSAEGQQ